MMEEELFKVIKKAFEQIGYTVYDKVLNSKDLVSHRTEKEYILLHFGMILIAVDSIFQNLQILIPA